MYAAAKAADEDLEAEYDSDDQLVIVCFCVIAPLFFLPCLEKTRNWSHSSIGS